MRSSRRGSSRRGGTELIVRGGIRAWHPGRCAELAVVVDGVEQVIGYAGELHPGVLKTLGLPARTSAMELDLDVLEFASAGVPKAEDLHVPGRHAGCRAGRRDVGPARGRRGALREGAGELLESIRLFDVYEMLRSWARGRSRSRMRCGSARATGR